MGFESMFRSAGLTLILVVAFADAISGAMSPESPGPRVRWNPISDTSGYRTNGSGDPSSEDGATINIESMGAQTGKFGGVIAAVELANYRGRELELSAVIEVLEGPGSSAIWVRADRGGGGPAFATSASRPAMKGEPQERRVRLYVPTDSSKLVLGAIVQGDARARITNLRVEAKQSTMTEVSAFEVLEAAFSMVQMHALNAPSIDIAALRRSALTPDLRSTSSGAAYPRIFELLAALRDGHSFALPPSEARVTKTTGKLTGNIEARLIGKVGYVSVPGFLGTETSASSHFAGKLCEALSRFAANASAGWIVDLRQDTGGNMWPMLAGLMPLLGSGNYGSFRDRDGHDSPWATGKLKGCSAPIPQDVQVAVLVGSKTASSGESVAIAFSGMPNARSFGVATYGQSTSNRTFSLPDGGLLFLTTANNVDRTGKVFPNGLVPDVLIREIGTGDNALEAALAWLNRLNGSPKSRP